jgi:hypothetical protein
VGIGGGSDDIQVSNVVVPQQKHGHICCGKCCDVRRATIIVDIIAIIMIMSSFVLLAKIKQEASQNEFDDDNVERVVTRLPAFIWYTVYVVEIGLLSLAIRGAQIFNSKYVFVGFFLYCFGVVMALFTLNIVGIITNAFFAYPHYCLYNEIQRGIMTRENYHNEKYSCCCV